MGQMQATAGRRWQQAFKRFLGPLIIVSAFSFSYLKDEIHFFNKSSDNKSSPLNFSLKEISTEIGLNFSHSSFTVHPSLKNVEPWLASTGASVAVTDFNKDGFPDIYFTNSKIGAKNSLFRNNGDGTFADVAESAGVANVNDNYPSTAAIFFDCDNNGTEDLTLISYCPQLFKNQGNGTFINSTNESGIGECFPTVAAVNVIDFNNDSYLDLVIGGYFETDVIKNPTTTKVMPTNLLNSKNSSPIYVYQNNGSCQFTKVDTGIRSRGFSWSIGVYDFFGKGQKSLWIATDYGDDQLYTLDKTGKFIEQSEKVKTITTSRNGMSVDFADVLNDGTSYAYVSHIHAGKVRPSGNLLWKADSAKHLEDKAQDLNINRCGWSWGSKFVDLNNDRYQDLVVANGFITTQSKANDYWFSLSTLSAGFDNLTADAKLWPPMQKYSLDGHQVDCVFVSGQDGFKNVTSYTDFANDTSDGRGVAYIDYLNNGSLSLVIANQNGEAKFYKNTQINDHSWLGFSLQGKSSNRNAFGTIVKIELENGSVLTKELQPINGFSSQSDSRLHFGLGANAKIKHVSILWPNGKIDEMPGSEIDINRYLNIQESE